MKQEAKKYPLVPTHPIGWKLQLSFANFDGQIFEMKLGPPITLTTSYIKLWLHCHVGRGLRSIRKRKQCGETTGTYVVCMLGSRDTQHSPSFGGHEEDEKQNPSRFIIFCFHFFKHFARGK
jgi:hypothetical protein